VFVNHLADGVFQQDRTGRTIQSALQLDTVDQVDGNPTFSLRKVFK
jgi:hypothetical protein